MAPAGLQWAAERFMMGDPGLDQHDAMEGMAVPTMTISATERRTGRSAAEAWWVLGAVFLALALLGTGCATGGGATGAPAESPTTGVATPAAEASPLPTAVPAEVLPAGETAAATEPEAAGDELTPLELQWGVELVGVRRTAADRMLDVRYRVLDAAKAAPLFDRHTKAFLIHHPSGTEIPVYSPAKTGPLRSTNPPIAGRTYFIFFSNPSGLVKMGDSVTLKIGDYQASTAVQ